MPFGDRESIPESESEGGNKHAARLRGRKPREPVPELPSEVDSESSEAGLGEPV